LAELWREEVLLLEEEKQEVQGEQEASSFILKKPTNENSVKIKVLQLGYQQEWRRRRRRGRGGADRRRRRWEEQQSFSTVVFPPESRPRSLPASRPAWLDPAPRPGRSPATHA